MPHQVAFSQVDVFSAVPYRGNPLAVVTDARGLSDQQMLDITRWMNLSETTFVLPASHPGADYRIRIFTPDGELPFAGHPTLGTAHSLLERGLIQAHNGQVIQECAAGLITVRLQADQSLAFIAPPTEITPYESVLTETITGPLAENGLRPAVTGVGSRWLIVPFPGVEDIRAFSPSPVLLHDLAQDAGIKGIVAFAPVQDYSGEDYEVRVIFMQQGSRVEDPVTGSANACLAHYFNSNGMAHNYRARQGLSIGRYGKLDIRYQQGEILVGGHSVTLIQGNITLP